MTSTPPFREKKQNRKSEHAIHPCPRFFAAARLSLKMIHLFTLQYAQ